MIAENTSAVKCLGQMTERDRREILAAFEEKGRKFDAERRALAEREAEARIRRRLTDTRLKIASERDAVRRAAEREHRLATEEEIRRETGVRYKNGVRLGRRPDGPVFRRRTGSYREITTPDGRTRREFVAQPWARPSEYTREEYTGAAATPRYALAFPKLEEAPVPLTEWEGQEPLPADEELADLARYNEYLPENFTELRGRRELRDDLDDEFFADKPLLHDPAEHCPRCHRAPAMCACTDIAQPDREEDLSLTWRIYEAAKAERDDIARQIVGFESHRTTIRKLEALRLDSIAILVDELEAAERKLYGATRRLLDEEGGDVRPIYRTREDRPGYAGRGLEF